MNLKEAFRYQNFLQDLSNQICGVLMDEANITTVKNTHLRKKVYSEAENETILEEAPSEYADRITLLTEFYVNLLEEREKLSQAIHAAKAALPIDMDSEVALNSKRQDVRRTLQYMDGIRNGEKILSNLGTGYRFNAEGNQTTYRCDVKRVTTINFDRNAVRRNINALNRKIDEVSAEIDRCLINSEVPYMPPYDVNDSLDTVLETYSAK